MPRSTWLGASLLAAFLPSAALASEPAKLQAVELVLSGCEGLDEAETRKLLDMELATLGVTAPADTTIEVACTADDARIRLLHAGQQLLPIEVHVQMAVTEEGARPRLIALAASELAAQAARRATEPPPAAAEKPAAKSPPPAGREASKAPPPDRHLALAPFIAARLRRTGDPATSLVGGSTGLEVGIAPQVSLGFEARAERGSTELSTAKVEWKAFTVAALVYVGAAWGPLDCAIGAGAEVGRLELDAEALVANARGQALSGPWGGPLVSLRLRTPNTRGVFVRTSAEAGLVTLPVRGSLDGAGVLVDASGVWLAGSLGIGISL